MGDEVSALAHSVLHKMANTLQMTFSFTNYYISYSSCTEICHRRVHFPISLYWLPSSNNAYWNLWWHMALYSHWSVTWSKVSAKYWYCIAWKCLAKWHQYILHWDYICISYLFLLKRSSQQKHTNLFIFNYHGCLMICCTYWEYVVHTSKNSYRY